MKTIIKNWSISDLRSQYHNIEYPEFQREPTVWSVKKKRLLIDSILRKFDIGSIYLINTEKDSYECIDGGQRLNAIFSFLGVNADDNDNNFYFQPSNEVKEDDKFADIKDKRFSDTAFRTYTDTFMRYEVRIVLLSDFDEVELILQFQRLQVAQILNGAEKLNAMVGEMHDYIFSKGGIGELEYFTELGTRKGRYGNQQTASQVTINVFSYSDNGTFQRARFLDMQEFFKANFKIQPERKKYFDNLINSTNEIMRFVRPQTLQRIKNRALGVSILLFYYIIEMNSIFPESSFSKLDSFINMIIDKISKVAQKPITSRPGTWENLQLAITQASVEKYAIERRHAILKDEFERFIK